MPPEIAPPATSVAFTRDDVEAATRNGKKPWTRQIEFDSEIDPEDIAATAAAYGRAAGEARSAQDLAVRATEISTEGGGLDGTPLVDGEARIDATRGGLQDGGKNIDAVVEHLVRAMNLALATKEEVRGLIYSPQGLDSKYNGHVNAAIAEWNGWVQALNDAAANQSSVSFGAGIWAMGGGGTRGAGEPVPLDVTHPNGDWRLAPMTAQGWALPDDLPGQIRDKYLRLAAADAANTGDDIDAEIERYRRKMAELAGELRRLGYDPSAGPLDVWAPTNRTPDLSRWINHHYNIAGQRFLLDKRSMRHILERHHPTYLKGEPKRTQTYFDERLSIEDVGNIADQVVRQNSSEFARRGTGSTFQVSGVVDGVEYVMGVRNGKIGQLYPKPH